MNNQANIAYSYAGGTGTETASSNITTTTLLDEYSLVATKTALTPTYRPGEDLTYVIRLENSGMGDLYTVTVNDDLGAAGANSPLRYVASAVYVGGTAVTANVDVSDSGVSFVLPAPLAPGAEALIVLVVRVREDAGVTAPITNTAAVTAAGGSASGTAVTASPSPTATVTPRQYADLAIAKQGDKATVVPGETLTYTFTLTNTGNQSAENVVLTDKLPAGFSITGITAQTGGTTTTYTAGQYTVSADNTLTLPAAGGPEITVPAATAAGPGVTLLTVAGTVAG